MRTRLLYGLLLAVLVGVLSLIWIPGCGFVDPWLFWTWTCATAGGGGSGAG